MELSASGYLYNLSVVGIGFATVSALVSMLRQTMGGRMSNFDVYLLRTYVSVGLIVAVAAVIPQLLVLLHVPVESVWLVASGVASLPVIVFAFCNPIWRRNAVGPGMPVPIRVVIGLLWIAAAMLVVNAAAPSLRGAGPYALALTIFQTSVMWAFVRRIASLMGNTAGEDWNPNIS